MIASRDWRERPRRRLDPPAIRLGAEQRFKQSLSAGVLDGKELPVATREQAEQCGLAAQLGSRAPGPAQSQREIAPVIELDDRALGDGPLAIKRDEKVTSHYCT